MAKNRVDVKVIVSDDGSIKLTQASMKKLSTEVEKLPKNLQASDRAMKGVTSQSSNATKNFSKMQQVMGGGLVPAYAALAAQIFAISAAFRFLKSAGDFRVLQEGQVAYASATGVALKTLTNNIIEATDAQIKFTDAAQAAAIGTAAGLSPDQLTRLGNAAKDVSIVLGRDVTDSFNRLVRGVTKAEPELLDELGIILRLKEATQAYADTIGKTREQLNAYERSQAVAIDVLTQSEAKYSAILEITEASSNGFVKLEKSFDDLVNQLKIFLSVLEPLALLISKNPFGVLLLALPLLAPLFRPIIISTREWAEEMEAGSLKAQESIKKLKDEAKANLTNISVLRSKGDITKNVTFLNKELQKATENIKRFEKSRSGLATIQKGRASDLSTRTLDKILYAATNRLDEFKDIDDEARKTIIDNTKGLKNNLAARSKIWAISHQGMSNISKATWASIQATYLKGVSYIRAATLNALGFMQTLLTRALPIVGALSLAWSFLGESIQNTLKQAVGIEVLDKNAQKRLDTIRSLNEEYADFVEIQKASLKIAGEENKLLPQTLDNLIAIGNLSRAESIADATINIQEYATALARVENNRSDFEAGVVSMVSSLKTFVSELDETYKAIILVTLGIGTLILLMNKPALAVAAAAAALVAGGLYNRIDKLGAVAKETETRMQQLSDSLGEFEDIGGDAAREYKAFIDSVLEGNNQMNTKPSVEEFARLKNEFESVAAAAADYSRIQKQVGKDVTELLNSIIPSGKFDTVLTQLKDQAKDIVILGKNHSKVSKAMAEQFDTTKNQLAFYEKLNTAAIKRLRIEEEIKRVNIDSIRGLTPLVKKQAILRNQILETEFKIAKAEAERTETFETYIQAGKAIGALEWEGLQLAEQKTNELRLQLEILKDQTDAGYRITESFKDALESATSTNIYDLITGDEKSFKDAFLKTAEAAARGAAKTISDILTENIFTAFNIETKEQKERREQAEAFKNAIVKGMEEGTKLFKTGLSEELAKFNIGRVKKLEVVEEGRELSELKRAVDNITIVPDKELSIEELSTKGDSWFNPLYDVLQDIKDGVNRGYQATKANAIAAGVPKEVFEAIETLPDKISATYDSVLPPEDRKAFLKSEEERKDRERKMLAETEVRVTKAWASAIEQINILRDTASEAVSKAGELQYDAQAQNYTAYSLVFDSIIEGTKSFAKSLDEASASLTLFVTELFESIGESVSKATEFKGTPYKLPDDKAVKRISETDEDSYTGDLTRDNAIKRAQMDRVRNGVLNGLQDKPSEDPNYLNSTKPDENPILIDKGIPLDPAASSIIPLMGELDKILSNFVIDHTTQLVFWGDSFISQLSGVTPASASAAEQPSLSVSVMAPKEKVAETDSFGINDFLTKQFEKEKTLQEDSLDEQDKLLKEKTKAESELGKTIADTMAKGGSLDGIITSFLPQFDGILGGFANSILSAVLPSVAPGIGNFIGKVFGMANGGMVNGGFQSFAKGSAVVDSPTLGLIGEGKYNEAIVPLPDGKSIPVEMNGNSNSGTTTNVTINMSGNQVTSTDVQGPEQGARQLGKLVSLAVQRELQSQSRPGGLLSPYGAAR